MIEDGYDVKDRTGPARDRAEPVAQLLRVLVRLRADIARKDRPFGRVVADALCQMMRSQRLRVACPCLLRAC